MPELLSDGRILDQIVRIRGGGCEFVAAFVPRIPVVTPDPVPAYLMRSGSYASAADLDGSGTLTTNDVTQLVNIVLRK